MKALVLDSVSSPITKRVYNMALDEFFSWYAQEPRPGFAKATVSAWRVSLEERGLGSSSIIIRMSAIRKLAVEATDNGLLAPELGEEPGFTCLTISHCVDRGQPKSHFPDHKESSPDARLYACPYQARLCR